MTKKKHNIVWHKKKGKMIPASVLKPHKSILKDPSQTTESDNSKENRKKVFLQNLTLKIKKALE